MSIQTKNDKWYHFAYCGKYMKIKIEPINDATPSEKTTKEQAFVEECP